MHSRIKLLLILLFLANAPVVAQNKDTKNDTVKKQQQQQAMYKDIEQYSKKSKFTKLLHKLLFKSPSRRKTKTTSHNSQEEIHQLYREGEGKIIRNIKIVTLDPFGYSVSDTTRKPKKWIERTGNHAHIKTKQFAVKNRLLFKKHQRLDSLLLQESERLLRADRFVRRVVIKPVPIANSKDSVDVCVRVLDSWSLTPNGSISSSSTNIEITERNFMGWGHEFENRVDTDFNTGQTAYLARYQVANIKNTYIDSEINYAVLEDESSLKSIGFQRIFFSPVTRWAGGVYVAEELVRDSLPDAQGKWEIQNQKSVTQDYWAGYAHGIPNKDDTAERTTNFVTTLGFLQKDFEESPAIAYDSINYYSNERMYLASIGVTSRKFTQDKFLFNYDIIEDIPIGRAYSSTFGLQEKNNQQRLYLSGRYAYGHYYNFGFFSANAQIGSFFYKGRSAQTVFRLDMLYFSNVKQLGNWRFRNFIKPVLVIGSKRQQIITDQININEQNGIQGFNNRTLVGTKKFLLTMQTQSYSPWNLWGFRINPFVNFTMGMIGDKFNKLYQSKAYTKFGVGLLIYNDYLVFNSFQISMAFYPTIPGEGNNLLKTNTFKNDDITLPNFRISKPTIVPYE
ncbi:hypothetical protein [Flavobacterium litorale]|uniref:Outer membrane protein/protective antigen OMA87 n=1 Tax=Flavobacterium litorale TaxID=2856519 RepID=A0ABX8VAV7_9FLAO|nr:hypothetical protein [Flavobacterium litorale]QYJ68166.1 hypothetical protein K1I41_11655 [Flavobacterium litorale]